MAKIIEFPNKSEHRQISHITTPKTPTSPKVLAILPKIIIYGINVIWVVVALMYPFLSWVLGIDCAFQFFRMLYYWNDFKIHAGVTFLLHFSSFAALAVFVMAYKPKDFV